MLHPSTKFIWSHLYLSQTDRIPPMNIGIIDPLFLTSRNYDARFETWRTSTANPGIPAIEDPISIISLLFLSCKTESPFCRHMPWYMSILADENPNLWICWTTVDKHAQARPMPRNRIRMSLFDKWEDQQEWTHSASCHFKKRSLSFTVLYKLIAWHCSRRGWGSPSFSTPMTFPSAISTEPYEYGGFMF
jgi:hypothetical protein